MKRLWTEPIQEPASASQFSISQSRVFFAIAVLSITAALGHRFYNAPKLDIGRQAPETIEAPDTVRIEDSKATEEKRTMARKDVLPVLMREQALTEEVLQALRQALEQGSQIRQPAGSFPFTTTSILSVPIQIYLRKIPEAEWQAILNASDPVSFSGSSRSQPTPTPTSNLSRQEQQQAIAKLKTYRRTVNTSTDFDLLQTLTEARSRYATALASLPQPPTPETSTLYDATLLDLTDAEWKRTQAAILQAARRMLIQGIPVGLPESLQKEAIALNIQGIVPATGKPIATQVLMTKLKPNLVRDEEQTRARAEMAAQEIPPEIVAIKRNEVIVREGEVITSADFALLDHFGLSRRGINWLGLVCFGGVVGVAVAGYCFVERRFHRTLYRRDRVLIGLLVLSTSVLFVLRVPSTNLPAIGLLIGSFYGSPLGATVIALLTVVLPIGMELNWTHLVSSAAGGILSGVMAGQLRSREELALLGGVVGLLQGILYLVFNIASGFAWYTLLGSATIHALIGLAWCIVAIGSSPYLEQLFDLVTTIRLVELANPNRPLLKRLAEEAPGTFQHTLFVATLAEAAAKALGCNVELVRTGTLYHDIGKMHDPLGFIENQMGGPNKHDLINDPWKSADIIKKHVTQGLVMARKFRLPRAVQAFIPEHQGTMLISYFYHQAQQVAQQNSHPDSRIPTVNEADFRYDGPIPQSRETGIVMVADSCEAALRSLKDASTEEALAMINKILRARWQDQQLVRSGLTREEMSRIATIFVEVWQQFNHQRIVYPKAALNPSSAVNQ
jgi:putative nucleotidyltransferase with HDIG domain